MKKLVMGLWVAFVVCVGATVVLWFKMNEAELDYEEVEVKVVDSVEKKVKNTSTGTTYSTYEVTVEYNGHEWNLGNVHSASGYTKGRTVKAYLSNDKLYANIEGVRTSTPVSTAYFICLFGSFGLLMGAAVYSGKYAEEKKKNKNSTGE